MLVEAELALGLAEQMHGRREAAGDQHAIGRDALAADRHRLDAAGAMHGIDCGAPPHLDTAGRCGSRAPHVRDQHLRAGLLQRGGNRISLVVVGRDDDALADQHVVAPEIDERGIRRHHAGPVIVGKHQRPLDGAGRHHDRLRPDAPLRIAAIAAFPDADEIVVVDAEGRGIGKHALAGAAQLGDAGAPPIRRPGKPSISASR